jgi:hypothetical protein
MPPQPDGIWGHPGAIIKDWTNAEGEQRYRRAVYTFVKRAFMYPSFLTFDMETREISHQRRLPTNTPLQALVTLNDPVFHEAAQSLGKLMQFDAQTNDTTRGIVTGFKRVVSRQPNQLELNSLLEALTQIKQELAQDRTDSEVVDTQAWAAMGSVLLNLDDALTR